MKFIGDATLWGKFVSWVKRFVGMKKQLIVIIGFLFLTTFYSCKKDTDEVSAAIYNSWEVVDFMGIEMVVFPKKDNYNPVIEFKKDGSYLIKLDANSCSGTFKIFGGDSIEISTPGCTKMCCDSRYSQKIVSELSEVKTYSVDGNSVKLNVPGWGWIELERAH
jgi:heat shock protein HslJ